MCARACVRAPRANPLRRIIIFLHWKLLQRLRQGGKKRLERERGREKETKEVSAKEETAQHPNCEYGAKIGRKCGESGGPLVRLRAGSG